MSKKRMCLNCRYYHDDAGNNLDGLYGRCGLNLAKVIITSASEEEVKQRADYVYYFNCCGHFEQAVSHNHSWHESENSS